MHYTLLKRSFNPHLTRNAPAPARSAFYAPVLQSREPGTLLFASSNSAQRTAGSVLRKYIVRLSSVIRTFHGAEPATSKLSAHKGRIMQDPFTQGVAMAS